MCITLNQEPRTKNQEPRTKETGFPEFHLGRAATSKNDRAGEAVPGATENTPQFFTQVAASSVA